MNPSQQAAFEAAAGLGDVSGCSESVVYRGITGGAVFMGSLGTG